MSLDSKAFLEGLKLSKPFLELAATAEIRDKAERIAARAKAGAPVGTPEEGDSHPGAMRDDIGLKGEGVDAKGPFVDVGTREPYGLYQEFGTEHNPAHPFMRPAIAAESGSPLQTKVNLAPKSTSTAFKRVRKSK